MWLINDRQHSMLRYSDETFLLFLKKTYLSKTNTTKKLMTSLQ